MSDEMCIPCDHAVSVHQRYGCQAPGCKCPRNESTIEAVKMVKQAVAGAIGTAPGEPMSDDEREKQWAAVMADRETSLKMLKQAKRGVDRVPDPKSDDPVNHPAHYTAHPSGVECIQITEHMGFNLGNAVKYVWRAGEKGDAVEDLLKAAWYIDREIKRLSRQS